MPDDARGKLVEEEDVDDDAMVIVGEVSDGAAGVPGPAQNPPRVGCGAVRLPLAFRGRRTHRQRVHVRARLRPVPLPLAFALLLTPPFSLLFPLAFLFRRASTRRRMPRSVWYTKKLRRFATCSSRYASGRRKPLIAIRRYNAGTDDSEYPSEEYSKILSGRVRVGCTGASAGEVIARE